MWLRIPLPGTLGYSISKYATSRMLKADVTGIERMAFVKTALDQSLAFFDQVFS